MKSSSESKKRQLLADLISCRAEVLDAALALPIAEQEIPFLGTWSAHDVAAHLAGWDYADLEAIEAIRSGRLPAFYAQYDHDWSTLNARFVAEHRQKTLPETAAAARGSHEALLQALNALAAEDLVRDYGVRSAGKRRVTILLLLSVEARDEHKHAEQIRDFQAQGTSSATHAGQPPAQPAELQDQPTADSPSRPGPASAPTPVCSS